MKVIVVVNAAAGSTKSSDVEGLDSLLASTFERRGIEAELRFVEGDQIAATAKQALADAAEGAVDAIVVGGGDGTIRTVAAVFAGSGFAIGVLPLGTLNHFAKDLGIPADIAAAVDVIAAGHVRPVDLGSVNDAFFVNNSSIGMYPNMVIDRELQQKRGGLGKWSAMTLSLLRAIRRFRFRRLTICAEGTTALYRTPLLFVGNNEYDMNLLSLGRRKQLDVGKLYVYVTRSQTRLEFILLGLRAIFGGGRSAPNLDMLAVHSLEVRSSKRRILVALDGEVETMRTPLRYVAQPGALQVFAPEQLPCCLAGREPLHSE
jgi:YegS/Rv2252/BmrU family lipid kinase